MTRSIPGSESKGEEILFAPLLQVKNLRTSFFGHLGEVQAVRNISFDLLRGEILGIVGESGSGKSVTALSIMKLLQYPGKIVGGQILLDGEDLVPKKHRQMRRIHGQRLAMVFQDPMTSLNPLFTVGNQIIETIKEHKKLSRREAEAKAIHMLRLVGIPSPEKRLYSYPHEFSGGMRQRVMIAMALACSPELLIADEPTTALDVTIQAQVLELIRKLNVQLKTSTILITHNLGAAAGICDRILVMYGGRILEEGSVDEVFYDPRHPYTLGLLNSIPKGTEAASRRRLVPILGTPPDMLHPPEGCPFHPRCAHAMKICACAELPPVFTLGGTHRAGCWLLHSEAPQERFFKPVAVREPEKARRGERKETLIEVRDLKVYFKKNDGFLLRSNTCIRAVDGVSFSIRAGETFGLVGESGCGKSTTGAAMVGLHKPHSGQILYKGTNLAELREAEILKYRKKLQMIFQDPYASLNPRMTAADIIGEPLDIHGICSGRERRERIRELLEMVGLRGDHASRYPHEFSGGQRQRIGIARALAVNPEFIVCDEPVSALDVSIQAQVVNMLEELQERLGLTYLFIAHDLAVVRHISRRVGVMYLGSLVEIASVSELYEHPLHPYTQALLSAALVADPRKSRLREVHILEGDVPTPLGMPEGCRFATRCKQVLPICFRSSPVLGEISPGHAVACHHFGTSSDLGSSEIGSYDNPPLRD